MNYFENPAISQSYLKQLIEGPPFVEKETTSAMLLGTLVDMMLSRDEELENYVITPETLTLPSDKELEIINRILDNEQSFTVNEVRAIAERLDYGRTWKPETVFRKVVEENTDYINFYVTNKDKTVVDHQIYDKAVELSSLASRHKFSSAFFNTEYKNQVERYFTIEANEKSYNCKAKLDHVIAPKSTGFRLPNGKNLKGEVIVDYKVTTLHPATAIRKFRYDIQGAFYTESTALKETNNVHFVLLFLNPTLEYPTWVLLDKERLDIGKYGGDYYKDEWVLGNSDENDQVKGFVYGLKLHDFYTKYPKALPHYLEVTNGEIKLYGR